MQSFILICVVLARAYLFSLGTRSLIPRSVWNYQFPCRSLDVGPASCPVNNLRLATIPPSLLFHQAETYVKTSLQYLVCTSLRWMLFLLLVHQKHKEMERGFVDSVYSHLCWWRDDYNCCAKLYREYWSMGFLRAWLCDWFSRKCCC